jgi:N-methylhydantoinase B
MSESVKIDPVKLELVKNALVSMCDNMLGLVVRTARSTNIKNTLDFSATVCDPQGRLVAQGLTLPAHLGAIMPALKGCLDYFGDDLADGDILANNDPYAGGSHLNDIFMFKPVFVNGECAAILGLIIHHTDLGGRVPGGNAADSSEIFQEGLRIPPSKIYTEGKPNITLLRIIEHNTRIPERAMGDVMAQIATLQGAHNELRTIIGDVGPQLFKIYANELLDYAERLARADIAAIPDGEAEFVDWIDDDGAGSPPVKLKVKITKRADQFIVDFDGTDPQGKGALQPNLAFTTSCTFAALRTTLDPEIPNNAGFYRAVTVTAPEGCFLNPRYPAATGARGLVGFRVRSLVFGALAQLLPDRVPACTGGSEFGIVFAGYEQADRKPFLHLEYHNTTGQGASADRDGQDGGPYCIGNLANTPVEVIEAETPLRVEQYAFLPDTGGAGEFRGALGIVRQYRLMTEEATVQLRSDRQLHACWGLFGGQAGSLARSLLNPGADDAEALPSKFVRKMRRQDVFRAEMPGSGGYGNPIKRDPEAVRRDVIQGKVTIEHAKQAYGVVLDGSNNVDMTKTMAERADRMTGQT